MALDGFRSDLDWDRPSSFCKLPLNQYKYVLTKDMGRSRIYRVMPNFIQVRPGADYGNVIFPSTIYSYYINKEYVMQGFELKFDYPNGQTIVYKKGFTRHLPYSYSIHNNPQIHMKEVTGDGEIMISLDNYIIGMVLVYEDNYETMFRTSRSNGRESLDDIVFEKKIYNYSGDISRYLPDMGGYIK